MNKKNKQILCFIMAVIVLIAIFLVIIIKNRPIIDQNTNENTEIQQENVENNDSTTEKEQPEEEKKDSESYYVYEMEIDEYDSTVDLKETTNEEKETAKKAKSIEIELDLLENPGYALMSIRCYFNPDVFSFESITNGSVHPNVDETPVIQKDKYGTFFLIYFDYTGSDIYGTGTLASIVFNVEDAEIYNQEDIKFVIQEVYNKKPEKIDGVVLNNKIVDIKYFEG